MKVLYFHQYFQASTGSWPTRSYEFARHLVSQGHEVTMVAGLPDLSGASDGHKMHESDVDGIRVLWLGMPYSQHLGTPGRLLSFAAYASLGSLVAARVDKPDVVFATSTPLSVGIPGLMTARIMGAPFVFEVRDLWPEIPIALGFLKNKASIKAVTALERCLYREASALIALSPGMARGMIAAGADSKKITVIPNMADLSLFAQHQEGAGWRDEVGIPQEATVAIHHGTMGLVNDVGQLVDAAQVLQDSGIYMALIGQGKERAMLEARVQDAGLSNVVFDGPRPRSTMPWVLSQADIGVMCVKHVPALYHNCANKFGDFLAAGLPVVVTYPGWQGKLLESYGAGVVANTVEGPDNLAKALLAIKADSSERLAMAMNARRLGRLEFARDDLVVRFEEVLLDAIKA